MRKLLCMLMLVVLVTGPLAAQTRVVTGKVTDSKGKPLAGASVIIPGTTNGTSTSDDGQFSITVPAAARLFIISSLNFESQTVALSLQSNYAITLVPGKDQLESVIVTGYGNVSKSKSPIASVVVGAKDIRDVPMTNVNDILQGKVAGLTVMSTTGQPGGQSNVRIRGVGSISASQGPLYVIDGTVVETGQFINGAVGGSTQFTQNNDILSNLNPADIETATVLKDAAAQALYGSRGANGVIIITTKKGKAGSSAINFSAQYGVTQPSLGNFGMMNARQTYDYERAVLALNGYTQAEIDADYPATLLNKTFDWVDAAFVNGNVQNYNLSVSGGNDKTRQYLSLGYYDQEGTILNSRFKRITANLNIDHTVTSRLKVGAHFNTSFSNTLNADGSGYYSSPINGSMSNSPLWVYPYKEDGSLYVGTESEFSKGSGNNPNNDNFLYSSRLNYNWAKQFRGLGKVYGELKIANWLSLKQNAVIDLVYSREKNFFDPTTANGINSSTDPTQNGTIFEALNNPITFTSQTSASGNIALKDSRHELDYFALMEYQKFSGSTVLTSGSGIVDGRLQELGVTATPVTAAGTITEYSFLSYLAQFNYSFQSRYAFTASFRRDGSSRFGVKNRFANFYAVGGSWRVINEVFMQNQALFTDLRLRVSYGTSGVAGFGNYAAKALYAYGSTTAPTTYNGAPGSAPSTPGNPELSWERSSQFDVGLEFAVLKNRIRATVDLYRKVSNDLLQNVPVSQTVGTPHIPDNVGKLENKGVEVTLSTRNIATKDFNWTTDFNVAHNRNEVLKLYGGKDIPNGTLGRTSQGQPLGSWFLPVWAGVDPANGDPLWYLADGKTTTNSYAIASRTDNRKFVGTALPKYIFGLNNSLNYKGIGFSFFLYAITGSKIYNQNMTFLGDTDGSTFGNAYYKDVDKNYWTTPGQIAERPKPVVGGNKNSSRASSRWIESNDYIRLRNVTLSYSVPKNIINRAAISNVRLYVAGTNLLTYTGYRGIDPETSIGGNDVFKYPVNKTISVGVDITL